jgi:hypothetical protein
VRENLEALEGGLPGIDLTTVERLAFVASLTISQAALSLQSATPPSGRAYVWIFSQAGDSALMSPRSHLETPERHRAAHLIQTPQIPARGSKPAFHPSMWVHKRGWQSGAQRVIDRFQGLNERTCQSPCQLLSSPCTQDCELPDTKLARNRGMSVHPAYRPRRSA